MSLRYGSALAQPEPVEYDSIHQVTQGSLNRSWRSITSPKKTLGLAPTDYSQHVEKDFYRGEDTKRLKELLHTTRDVTLTAKEVQQAKTVGRQSVGTYDDSNDGTVTLLPSRVTQSSTNLSKAHASTRSGLFRPSRVPVTRPKLIPPLRSVVGGRQRQNYEWRPPQLVPIPNPAIQPTHAEMKDIFPYNTRATHHKHAINPNVDSGYYTTHWDDRTTRNPYQPYEVEVLTSSRALSLESSASAESNLNSSSHSTLTSNLSNTAPITLSVSQTIDPNHPLSPSRVKPLAASLGFGPRHREYTNYIHHSTSGFIDRSPGSDGAMANTFRPPPERIIMPLSTHLIESQVKSSTDTSEVDPSSASVPVALSVPYSLARFVPQDTRDGTGMKGHFRAAGLGYGKGHRNYYKYIHDNREANPEVALFRSTHCT